MKFCHYFQGVATFGLNGILFLKQQFQEEAQSVCEISESDELDDVVLALSQEVIDDFPASDPRWAESIPAG